MFYLLQSWRGEPMGWTMVFFGLEVVLHHSILAGSLPRTGLFKENTTI